MIATLLIALVALLHAYFMYLEMVAWDTPAGRKAFGLTPNFSAETKALAQTRGYTTAFSSPASSGGCGWATPAMRSRSSSSLRDRRRPVRRGDGRTQDPLRAGAAGCPGARSLLAGI